MFDKKIKREFEADQVVMESELMAAVNDLRTDWLEELGNCCCLDSISDERIDEIKGEVYIRIQSYLEVLCALDIISGATFNRLTSKAIKEIERIAAESRQQEGENENGKQ